MNCDSHDNYDPTGRQGDGDTTKFYGCRAWWNSDDGFDVLAQEFPVVVENSYAMGNGYIHYGTSKPPSFLKLKKGSRAIDKGEDLGFPFVGEAPDLGAFEYGMSSSSTTSLFRKVVRNSRDLKSRSVKAFDLQGRFLGKVPVEYGVDFVPNKNVYLKY